VNYQASSVCPDAYGPVFAKPVTPVAALPAAIETVQRQAAAHGFARPQVAMYTGVLHGVQFGGNTYRVRLAYRDGGLDQLRLVSGDRAPGLWMGNDLASSKRIPLGTRCGAGTPPPVTGIYADLYSPAPRWWCSQQDLAVHNRLVDHIDTGSVLFATDRETFTRALGPTRTLERLSITFEEPAPHPYPQHSPKRDTEVFCRPLPVPAIACGGGSTGSHPARFTTRTPG
jgi:putative ABC transport system permease protein